MAIINKKDIYSDEPLFTNLLKDLEKLNKEISKLTQSNSKLSNSLQRVKKTSDGSEAKELAKITKQLNNSTNKLNVTTSKQAKKLQDVKIEQQRLNKVEKDSAILRNEHITAYQKEGIKLKNLRNAYKNLAFQNKQNTKEGKRLLANITKLDKKFKSVDNVVGQNQRTVGKYTNAIKGLGKQLIGSLGVVAGVQALVSVLKDAFKIFVNFEKANSKLAAILGQTSKEIKNLTEQAKELGATSAYTATQVLELQTELAKLGFSSTDIENMTGAILDLASATGSELASAAELAGATLKIFNLSSEETKRVTDVLAVSTVKSSLSMEKLSTALPTVGKTAQIAGVSLERTVSLLGTLTDRGIDASTASTALRNVFLQLSKKGITWDEALTQINESTDKNKTSMDIFGVRSAAVGVILSQTKGSTDELEKSLTELDTTAKEIAETMLNNVSGDITKANSAWEGFVLSIADGNGIISKATRSIVQSFTDLITSATLFNKTSIEIKLKMIANAALNLFEKAFYPLIGALKLLGIEMPRFDATVKTASKGLGKLNDKTKAQNILDEELLKQTKLLQDEIDARKNKTDGLTKSQKSLNEELGKSARIDTPAATIETLGTDAILNKKNEKEGLLSINKWYNEQVKSQNDIAREEEFEAKEEAAQQDLEQKELTENAKKEFAVESAKVAGQFAMDLVNNFYDEKKSKIETDAQAEIDILKNKLDKGLISEDDFAKQKAKIEAKARYDKAKEDRKSALWSIVINTAVSLITTLANLGMPAAIPGMIAAAAMGTVQAAAVLAQPLPKLAKGEVNIGGKSHAQGGNIVEVEKGESYINKHATADSMNLLNMINDGIISDKNFPIINNENDNMLLASILMSGNETSKKLLTTMMNLGYSYDKENVRHIVKADGSMIEKFKINE